MKQVYYRAIDRTRRIASTLAWPAALIVGAAKAIPSLSRLYHSVAHLGKRSARTPASANHLENTFPTEHRLGRCMQRCAERRVGGSLTGTSSCGVFNQSVEQWSRFITSPMQA